MIVLVVPEAPVFPGETKIGSGVFQGQHKIERDGFSKKCNVNIEYSAGPAR